MRNPYEEDSNAWDLYECGERLESEAKNQDEAINAADRRTAALYKIGAALAQELKSLGDVRHVYSVAEDIGMDLTRLGDSISEIATAIKGPVAVAAIKSPKTTIQKKKKRSA